MNSLRAQPVRSTIEWEQWFGRQFERVAGNERLTAQLLSSLASSKTARRWVEETVKLAIGAMQLPGRERIEALEQRIATLEAQVAQLTRQDPK